MITWLAFTMGALKPKLESNYTCTYIATVTITMAMKPCMHADCDQRAV